MQDRSSAYGLDAKRHSAKAGKDRGGVVGLLDRWPLAASARRIPIHAYRGETPESTAALRESTFLNELDRQAAIYSTSFMEAMRAALVIGDQEVCWRHLQSSLFAAIIVNRLVDDRHDVRGWPGVPKQEARDLASERARRLRELVFLPGPDECDSPIYAIGPVRDAMEHFDERLDRATHQDHAASVSDWYLSDGTLRLSLDADPSETPAGLRAFVPTAGMLFFNDVRVDMFQLDLDMLALRHHISDGREELQARATGRFEFAQGQLVEFSDLATRLAMLESWEVEREERASTLA